MVKSNFRRIAVSSSRLQSSFMLPLATSVVGLMGSFLTDMSAIG